jgi:hypothetical protein
LGTEPAELHDRRVARIERKLADRHR